MNIFAYDSLYRASLALKELVDLRLQGIHKFAPKIQMETKLGPYSLRSVESSSELKLALRLRNKIRRQRLQHVQKLSWQSDLDDYDATSDHLLLYHKSFNDPIGTFRLNCGNDKSDFSIQHKFNIERICALTGNKVSLSRFCLDPQIDLGFAHQILWKALASYASQQKAEIILATPSLNTKSLREAALIYRYLFEQGAIHQRYLCPPLRKHSQPELDLWINYFRSPLSEHEQSEAQNVISPLLKKIIQSGGYISGSPVLDDSNFIIEFLTILPRESLNISLWKRS